LTENIIFDRIDFTENKMSVDEYENCRFLNCNFHEVILLNITFRECNFENCDFSLSQLKNTALNDCFFKGCKLLGVQFDECNPFLFSVRFENCMLNLAVFYKMKLKKMRFENCSLQETDFTETDLSFAVFENCDLNRAVFQHSNLENTDFRSAIRYSIDPEINRIKKAKFSRSGIDGLLDKYGIEVED
jgi:uncharacterized protein YjbI with pentapeptide repeats